MRIAIGGIANESCSFSTHISRHRDFTILRGDGMRVRYPFLDKFAATPLLLLRARAIPGGPIELESYRRMKGDFLSRLTQSGPVDGVYLDLHGAMYVRGMEDAEGDFITSVRNVAGPDALISASYDLHGNLSARVMKQLDMLTAYRTAPHIDETATREKAYAILVGCIEKNIRPVRAWVHIPVALPGEKTSTEWEPGASLYQGLKESDPVPGILDASMLMGYPWVDEPRTGASIVVTGTDKIAVEREALMHAERFWSKRREFAFGAPTGTLDECIRLAQESQNRPVIISDSGDNPTAGGAGDIPLALEALLRAQVPDALLAGIADEAATDVCLSAGIGAEVQLSLGGKLDARAAQPLAVTARVLFTIPGDDARVVVQIGGVKVIITRKRRPFHHIADFTELGITPEDHNIIVVKIGYLEPELKALAKANFLALSPGAVDQAIERLPYKRVTRPIFPLDVGMEWTPKAQLFP